MFSRFFIERPIFAVVVAIIIAIAGLVAMTVLPVQQYPNITPVQVTVQATYPGADSKTLADYLLYEGGVACLDGKCFGAQGDGYLRLSYASSFENILEAVERIRRVSSKWNAKV